MDFIDLAQQYKKISNNIEIAISKVLNHGKYILGPEVKELEDTLAKYVNVKHCISCSSGTDALLMVLLANNYDKTDAVFIPSFTFISTAEVVKLSGATLFFVDVDPKTYNIDIRSLEGQINKAIDLDFTPRCVIPVNIFGLCADYDELKAVSNKFNLFVLEDAAQSFGASIGNQKSCSFGDASATSFYPSKPLGCYGDGGAIFTNNSNLYEKLISIRNHGTTKDNKYKHDIIGINGRLDTIQAAILIEKLKIFDNELDRRQIVANIYKSILEPKFKFQHIPKLYVSSYAQLSIVLNSQEERDSTIAKLKDKGIPTAVHYPIPLHKQVVYSSHNYISLKNSELISNTIFSLPMHAYLSENEITKICNVIND